MVSTIHREVVTTMNISEFVSLVILFSLGVLRAHISNQM